MKNTSPEGWQRTSPWAILFFFGKFIKVITQNAWQSLAPLAAFVYAYEGELVTKIFIGIIAFSVLSVVLSLLNYWFFRFRLLDDSILIRQGVLRKSQLDINFDRIQGINTQQNIVYRYLGLVTVSFDTAGSSDDEGSIPAVTPAFADSLRATIGTRRPRDTEVDVFTPPESDGLLSLDSRDIIRIGLTDRRALIVFGVLSSLIASMDDNLYRIVVRFFKLAIGSAQQMSLVVEVLMVSAAVIAVIMLLALLSVAAAFLRYHNFKLFLDEDTLRSRGGLLTRHEVSMNVGKIQTLRLEQGILMRWFARYRLSGRQARSSQKHAKDKNFIIPIVTAVQARHLSDILLATEGDGLMQIPTSPEFSSISPYYMRTRLVLVSLVPTVAGVAVFWNSLGPASLVFVLWLAVSGLLIYQNWRRSGYFLNAEGCVRRSGLLGYRSAALLFRKVQRVTVTQSRYQRRKNLASLRFYMASGSVRIPFIEHATAKSLRDYTLYKVESSDRAWH